MLSTGRFAIRLAANRLPPARHGHSHQQARATHPERLAKHHSRDIGARRADWNANSDLTTVYASSQYRPSAAGADPSAPNKPDSMATGRSGTIDASA